MYAAVYGCRRNCTIIRDCKIFTRYKDCGLDGLTDRFRRPYRHVRQLPFQIEKLIVQLKPL